MFFILHWMGLSLATIPFSFGMPQGSFFLPSLFSVFLFFAHPRNSQRDFTNNRKSCTGKNGGFLNLHHSFPTSPFSSQLLCDWIPGEMD